MRHPEGGFVERATRGAPDAGRGGEMTPALHALAESGVLDGGCTLPTARLSRAYVVALVRMAEEAGRPVVDSRVYREAVLLSGAYLGGTWLAHGERISWRARP